MQQSTSVQPIILTSFSLINGISYQQRRCIEVCDALSTINTNAKFRCEYKVLIWYDKGSTVTIM